MKKTFTICVMIITLFTTSCAHAYYKEPFAEKDVAVHKVNNIFN